MRASIEERWWNKVDRRGDDECWPWLAARDRDGYGKFQYGPKGGQTHIRAHRWIVDYLHGPIPLGLVVLHSCDNPPCVNPAHLSVGTVADNNAEKFARDRHPIPWGTPLANLRKTECKRGHSLADAYVDSRGFRHCRECGRAASRRHYHKKGGSGDVL